MLEKGSLKCELLLLAENRVCLAQHSLKNCAVLVHSEKPLGLKKVKSVMGRNNFLTYEYITLKQMFHFTVKVCNLL